MSRYIAMAIIRIEHNYYNPPVNRFVDLEPTPETQKLMKQRGVMLRKNGDCEWQWIMPDDSPGFMDQDVLEVSMTVKDPYFLQQIESNGYDLGSLYKFSVEDGMVEVNADYVWRKEANGQRLKDEFCRIVLKPEETAPERLQVLHTKMEHLEKGDVRKETKEQFGAIKQEIRQLQEICCPKFTLRFNSPAYYWEYLCIFRDENDLRGKNLSMKCLDRDNLMSFLPPEKCGKTEFGTNVWKIVSTAPIPLKERYNYSLQLYIGTRAESRFVSSPQVGKYRSGSPRTIREICYIREQ